MHWEKDAALLCPVGDHIPGDIQHGDDMEYVEIDKHKMHVIDWYWVGKTKAWIIPGTEDMMPYIYGKTLISKWVSSSNSNGGIEASRKLTA